MRFFTSCFAPRMTATCVVLLSLLLAAAPKTAHAQAQVLFDDFGVGDSYGSGSYVETLGVLDIPPRKNAFQFTAMNSAVIGSADAAVAYLASSDGGSKATFNIFSSNGKAPGSLLFSSAPQTLGARGIYTFSPATGYTLTTLTAGTQYFALVSPSGSLAGPDFWYLNNTGVIGNRAFGRSYTYDTFDMAPLPAFRINAVASAGAPEPSALALLGMGLTVGAGVFSRSREMVKRHKAQKQAI